MSEIRLVGTVAALIAILLAAVPTAGLGQSLEEAETQRRVTELYNAGKYSEALPLAQRVLSTREKALGPNHPLVATSLFNLAELYRVQGRYGEAESFFKR